MNICVICSEDYEDSYDQCPYCGCPKDKYTIANLGFPGKLEQQYILIGLKMGSGGRQYLSLMSQKTGKKILAGKVQAQEKELQYLVTEQRREKLPELPAVYEMSKQPSELIFLFEDVPGVTLRELAERNYPLEEQTIQHAMDFAADISERLVQQGYRLGKTDWSSCVITDTGIRMRDFGGKEIQSGETDLFSEWRRPPYTNMQRTGIKEILLENRAQLIIIALLSVILIFEIISLLTHSVR